MREHERVIGRLDRADVYADAGARSLRHPAVCGVYFLAVIVLCMSAFHPVLLGIAFVSGLLYSICLRGGREVARSLRWQLPLVLVVMLLNPLASTKGATVLFSIGGHPFCLESLAYGACMGVLLVSTVLWLSNTSHVLTPDRVRGLLGRRAPVVALMTSMTMRLVPRYVERGNAVAEVQRACTSASPRDGGAAGGRTGVRRRSAPFLRLMSLLMGSSMEDALETADSMRARGWSAHGGRTVYVRRRFRARDVADLAVVGALVALSVFVAVRLCANFAYSFYPTMTPVVLWWGYLPYALLFFLPLLLALREEGSGL